MDNYAVLKGTSYILAHVPDMVLRSGTTQTTERIVNPGSEYLKELPRHLRSFEDVLAYPPNQVYIGNLSDDALKEISFPWYDKKVPSPKKTGRFGEIMEQDEFLGLMQICDVFDLVKLKKNFAASVKAKLAVHGMFTEEQLAVLDKNEGDQAEIEGLISEEKAEGLYHNFELVGAVKKAHDVDTNLSGHVMLENIAAKASCVLALLNLVHRGGIDPEDIEYVMDCSEEACGDMNQRGGGNFAKAAAEIAGLKNATGADVRGFCAGPVHAVLIASSLIKAGTFKNVAVVAGGCTAKLGMNGKDHVKKNIPVLEDCLGGFALLFSRDDGLSPVIRTDIVGRHTVGTGSSPQAVISSLVADPLERAGLSITDVDKYAPELQNPDITKPAGAGDVSLSNLKMIAALAVKKGVLKRSDMPDFIRVHGLTGWAPTQGHIPSGVPYLGFARDDITAGKIDRVMLIGKGSLFLGRMTNLFDGVSVIIEKNPASSGGSIGKASRGFDRETSGMAEAAETEDLAFQIPETAVSLGIHKNTQGEAQIKTPVIGIAVSGSEHGEDTIQEGVRMARKKGHRVIVISGEDAHEKMEDMLEKGEIDGAVTMHYTFPVGVSTVGRIITPARGKEMFLASTTGMSSANRAESMVKNAVYGIIAAKASGLKDPSVGIVNIDGARQAEKALLKLKANGYPIRFAKSERADGGILMRGNDLLSGSADIMVTDSLTGNLLVKIFSAYNSGGNYESSGYGYGPGIGKNYGRVIAIVSRASGAPVIAGAVEYTETMIKNDLPRIAEEEFAAAEKAGLKDILALFHENEREAKASKPPKETVTCEIHGVEVTDIDEAAACLWKEGIYAETGMGCTGPVVLVSEKNLSRAEKLLAENKYIDL